MDAAAEKHEADNASGTSYQLRNTENTSHTVEDVSHSKSKLSEQRRRHPKTTKIGPCKFSRYKAAQSKIPSEKRDLLIIKKKQQDLETQVKVSINLKTAEYNKD